MNTYHSGDSILRGYDTGHDWFDITWLPVIYPTRCFPFSELVGPYPFEDGDCFGRCGKGCIGDGPPNNELNIFTQNCFNHDKCVGVFGYVHPYCNQMFLYAINDFLFGVNCTDDSDEDGILDDGDFSGTPGDNPCTEGATQDCDDNCPKDSNPEQADADGDGIGDACDGDPTGGTDGLFAN
jgi:hypothetical protein